MSPSPLLSRLTPLALLAAGCGDASGVPDAPDAPAAHPDHPPTARHGVMADLRAARDAPRSSADGGGRAWLEEGESVPARAGRSGRWTLVYAAGPEGVAEGGFVRLTVPAFWEWTPAQTSDPAFAGYTEASTTAEGVVLEPVEAPGQWVDWVIGGRALAEGEEVRIVYGAGEAGARADKYAESGSRFWISVDGDGDGIGRILPDSPAVDVLPGPPARLLLTAPSTAEPDERFELRVAVLDPVMNAGVELAGTIQLLAAPEGLDLPAEVELPADARGVLSVPVTPRQKGVFRIVARLEHEGGELIGESNPLLVEPGVARIRWGDLHGHSNLSDGTGTPEEFLRYARDVGALDVVSLTDHDHWGMLPLDEHPELWEEIRTRTEAFHEPGRFVTLLGYEWTNWIHGHRHVLYFGDDGPVISMLDEATDTPAELWGALRARGLDALTFAHHSAGGPVATNWADFPPDPEFEPVTEVASVHGASEALDAPQRIYSPLEGNFVRDVLDDGHRLGFVGSGDSHNGHPGLAHRISPNMGGLAALLTDDLTRAGVRAALRSRRCYATNGPRIVLRAALEGNRMGATLAPVEGDAFLYVRAVACAPILRIDVVRSGAVVDRLDGEGYWDVESAFQLPGLASGEYVYVRVVQEDGGAAWSSPFFVE